MKTKLFIQLEAQQLNTLLSCIKVSDPHFWNVFLSIDPQLVLSSFWNHEVALCCSLPIHQHWWPRLRECSQDRAHYWRTPKDWCHQPNRACKGNSLMNITNNKRPNVKSCGTPFNLSLVQTDVAYYDCLMNKTSWVQSLKYDLNKSRALFLIKIVSFKLAEQNGMIHPAKSLVIIHKSQTVNLVLV